MISVIRLVVELSPRAELLVVSLPVCSFERHRTVFRAACDYTVRYTAALAIKLSDARCHLLRLKVQKNSQWDIPACTVSCSAHCSIRACVHLVPGVTQCEDNLIKRGIFERIMNVTQFIRHVFSCLWSVLFRVALYMSKVWYCAWYDEAHE